LPQGIEILKKYQKIIKEQPPKYFADYLQLEKNIEAAPIKHNGAAIGFLYNPLFYGRQEIHSLEKACLQLANILEKVTAEYLKNPRFRKLFNFPQELEQLILVDPGYNTYFPMARFDIFYDFNTGSLKFCELNADGSSGMTKSLLLDQEFSQIKPVEKLKEHYSITYLDPVQTWLSALLENYAQFKGNKLAKINIAIIDINWAEQGMVTEFQEFRRLLEALGHCVVICDPRELKLKNGKLFYEDMSIDLIYRRAVTSDLLEIYDEITDLLKAIATQAVCLVGSFRSQIIHNKQIFAILHQAQLLKFLTDEERQFITKYIPYTAIFHGELKKKVLDEPSKWVLKPLDSYQSQGVYIGKDYKQKEWQEIVEDIVPGQYLLQEFVDVPKLPLFDYQKNKFIEGEYNQMIGLFLYNKKFTGFYTRVSPLNNVASGLGAVAVSNLIVE